MPRNSKNNEHVCIYKIACIDEIVPECYVGRTANFKTCMQFHETNCKNLKTKLPLYNFIRTAGGWENWQMTELRTLDASEDVDRCHHDYIISLNATLNKNVVGRTPEEFKAIQNEANRSKYRQIVDAGNSLTQELTEEQKIHKRAYNKKRTDAMTEDERDRRRLMQNEAYHARKAKKQNEVIG